MSDRCENAFLQTRRRYVDSRLCCLRTCCRRASWDLKSVGHCSQAKGRAPSSWCFTQYPEQSACCQSSSIAGRSTLPRGEARPRRMKARRSPAWESAVAIVSRKEAHSTHAGHPPAPAWAARARASCAAPRAWPSPSTAVASTSAGRQQGRGARTAHGRLERVNDHQAHHLQPSRHLRRQRLRADAVRGEGRLDSRHAVRAAVVPRDQLSCGHCGWSRCTSAHRAMPALFIEALGMRRGHAHALVREVGSGSDGPFPPCLAASPSWRDARPDSPTRCAH
jgi:hypothetical protein